MKKFINSTLIENVVNQFGGWDEFVKSAQDVADYGINNGYAGWIYHDETVEFTCINIDDIIAMAENLADDIGEDLLSMVGNFNCLKEYDLSANELAKAIYAGKGELADQIYNCLAWFAGEEVCRMYLDYMGEN